MLDSIADRYNIEYRVTTYISGLLDNLPEGCSISTLQALADKLEHMYCNLYQGPELQAMMKSFYTTGVRPLSKPRRRWQDHGEYLGKGHFRWNETAQILNDEDLAHVKRYFNL